MTRTYSKSRSMAGARIGYTIAGAAISSDMDKLRYTTNPYNMDSLALSLGLAASRDADYYKTRCRIIAETRDATAEKLRGAGLEVLPSKANFIFVRVPGKDGRELYESLRAKQILVRHFDLPRIKDYIRVTIGTPEQMDKFYDALSDILNI